MDEVRIQLIDPADCVPSDDGDPAGRADIDFLFASIKADGQKVPVLVAADEQRPGKYRYIDGHGRGYCLAKLKQKMQAIILPEAVTEARLIEFKFATNLLRRSMSTEEIAIEAKRYMEVTGSNQTEAATRLHCSDATLSRALKSVRRIPPELWAEARRLGPSFLSLIASLPTAEAMKKAIDFANTPGKDGKKPTRDQLARFVDGLKGPKLVRGGRLKQESFGIDARHFAVELKPGDTTETLIEAFKDVVATLSKHRTVPLEALFLILRGKESAAA